MIEIKVSVDLLNKILRTGSDLHARIEKGLPEGIALSAIFAEGQDMIVLRYRESDGNPEIRQEDILVTRLHCLETMERVEKFLARSKWYWVEDDKAEANELRMADELRAMREGIK